MQGQFLENSWKRVCGIKKGNIHELGYFAFQNKIAGSFGGRAEGLEGHCSPRKEGREEGESHRERGDAEQAIPPSQPVAFKCLGFPFPGGWGPAELIAKCWRNSILSGGREIPRVGEGGPGSLLGGRGRFLLPASLPGRYRLTRQAKG